VQLRNVSKVEYIGGNKVSVDGKCKIDLIEYSESLHLGKDVVVESVVRKDSSYDFEALFGETKQISSLKATGSLRSHLHQIFEVPSSEWENNDYLRERLHLLSRNMLLEILEKHGISSEGDKGELVERILSS